MKFLPITALLFINVGVSLAAPGANLPPTLTKRAAAITEVKGDNGITTPLTIQPGMVLRLINSRNGTPVLEMTVRVYGPLPMSAFAQLDISILPRLPATVVATYCHGERTRLLPLTLLMLGAMIRRALASMRKTRRRRIVLSHRRGMEGSSSPLQTSTGRESVLPVADARCFSVFQSTAARREAKERRRAGSWSKFAY